MASVNIKQWGMVVVIMCVASVVVWISLFGGSANAAPPYFVGYQGTPVKYAVPGKPITVNYKVTNTGTTVYSGVKVIFHIPSGLTHSSVSPANAELIDDTVTWENVPIAAGKSFYPSLTLTMDANTPLKTKRSVWVEVTGTDMEANSQNFSLTAVAKVAGQATLVSTSSTVNSIFQLVYSRAPTSSESAYWVGRYADKPGRGSLIGAMQYHESLGIAH